MTYQRLKELGTLIATKDYYDGGIYLWTHETWFCQGRVYIHDEHPNLNRYTGKTETRQEMATVREILESDDITTEGKATLKKVYDDYKVKMISERSKNIIKQLRLETGLSQQKLADAAGITLSQVQKLEYGEIQLANVTFSTAVKIANAFGISADQLWTRGEK
jgi:DNA-binding XRE family transcriptional regulator